MAEPAGLGSAWKAPAVPVQSRPNKLADYPKAIQLLTGQIADISIIERPGPQIPSGDAAPPMNKSYPSGCELKSHLNQRTQTQ
jgi:hypothetical protein